MVQAWSRSPLWGTVVTCRLARFTRVATACTEACAPYLWGWLHAHLQGECSWWEGEGAPPGGGTPGSLLVGIGVSQGGCLESNLAWPCKQMPYWLHFAPGLVPLAGTHKFRLWCLLGVSAVLACVPAGGHTSSGVALGMFSVAVLSSGAHSLPFVLPTQHQAAMQLEIGCGPGES